MFDYAFYGVVLILVVIAVVLLIAVLLPADHWDVYPQCDAPYPTWKVHHNNAMGVYKEYFVRMTPAEYEQECR